MMLLRKFLPFFGFTSGEPNKKDNCPLQTMTRHHLNFELFTQWKTVVKTDKQNKLPAFHSRQLTCNLCLVILQCLVPNTFHLLIWRMRRYSNTAAWAPMSYICEILGKRKGVMLTMFSLDWISQFQFDTKIHRMKERQESINLTQD